MTKQTHAAVVGTGAMGAGITLTIALGGLSVTCLARRQGSREEAVARIESAASGLVEAGLLEPAERDAAQGRIEFATQLRSVVADADLVVESVPESLSVKLDVLSRISEFAPGGALIATNTSSLPLDELAGAVSGPERFAGLHWFLPAELVEVVEVVAADATAQATVERLADLARSLGKRPVLVRRPVPGFLVNRLQYALLREAYALVEAGVCDPADVDAAVVGCLGPRWAAIGPIQSMDFAGLDVHLAAARELFPRLASGAHAPDLVESLVASGRLGAKSGAGVRGDYDDARRSAVARRRILAVSALRGVLDRDG